jgi:hypothetical protein
MLTMFLGRVGPVSLPLALAFKQQNRHEVIPEARFWLDNGYLKGAAAAAPL